MHGDKVPVFSFADLIARILGLFSSDSPDDPPKGKVVKDLHEENAKWTNEPDAPKVPRKEPVRLASKLWDTAFGSYKDLLGYDVAKHQGPVDHEKFEDYPFVFLKATEGGKDEKGEGYVDPRFAENKEKVIAAGKIWSAYHFARVSLKNSDGEEGFAEDGRNEAEWFLDHYGREILPGMMPPVLDIEWDKRADKAGVKAKDVVVFCEAFVQYIKDELGVWPIVYTGPNFWKYKLAKTMTLSQCPLWIVAGYKGITDQPSKEIPGWDWVIHQHSNSTVRPDGKPPGTSGKMDANYFRGSLADLRAMASIPEDAQKQELALS
jgi:lysozyme